MGWDNLWWVCLDLFCTTWILFSRHFHLAFIDLFALNKSAKNFLFMAVFSLSLLLRNIIWWHWHLCHKKFKELLFFFYHWINNLREVGGVTFSHQWRDFSFNDEEENLELLHLFKNDLFLLNFTAYSKYSLP